MNRYILYLLPILAILSGCATTEDLVSFNEGPRFRATPEGISNYRPVRIQPDDILHIQVFAIDPEAVIPFNVVGGQGAGVAAGNVNRDALQLSGYLVDKQGTIDFPVVGKVKLSGLDILEAKEALVKRLSNYLRDPVVNIRLLNFRVNVIGEVARPGTYPVINERLTVLEALALAGDLTVFGRRDSILLVRENDDERSYGYLDLNSTTIFQSPYFYLQQNDVIYVQPLRTKVAQVRDPASRVLPWVSALTSTAAFILSVIASGN